MKREVRHENTPCGRRTFFSDIQPLHPDVPGDTTGIALVRHEEIRYGISLARGTWVTFFSAEEILKIADFVRQHQQWLEWARAYNYGERHADPPGGYTPTTDDRYGEDVALYVLYTPVYRIHSDLSNDSTGIALVSNDAGRYGACVVGSFVFPSSFYLAEDLLKIAAFAQLHHHWLKWGRERNREREENATTEDEYLTLWYDANADPGDEADVPVGAQFTILLFTEDSYAYYGIPTAEQELEEPYHWRAYPHRYWKAAVEELPQILLDGQPYRFEGSKQYYDEHLCRGEEMWLIEDIVKNGGRPLEEAYDCNPEEYWRKRSRMEFERLVYAFAEKYGVSLQQVVDHLGRFIAVEQGTLTRQQFQQATGILLKETPE